MSKILITGNGFDLFHGLPTKYGHFMAVMKTIEKYDFRKEVTFEDLFGSYFKVEYTQDYDLILNNFKTEDIVFDKQKTQELEGMLKANSWYKHFKNIIEIETWIDFENEIADILNQISLLFEISDNSNDKVNFRIDKKGLYENFTIFNFLKNDGVFVNIKLDYIDQRKRKINERKILMLLGHSFIEFSLIFNKYLLYVVNSFYQNYIGKSHFPIENIETFFTFNYTPTIEFLYKRNKLTYLHGSIKESIILGVNNLPKKVQENKGFEFLKSYQKIINNTNYNINKGVNSYEYIFLIFGHSLDYSDKEYILYLLDFVENSTFDEGKVIIFYKDLNDKKTKLANLFSYAEEKKIIDLEMSKKIEFVEISEETIDLHFKKS